MEDLHLFDEKPYIRHLYLAPNVVEICPVPVENTGHDEAFDNLKCEILQFPPQNEPPNIAA